MISEIFFPETGFVRGLHGCKVPFIRASSSGCCRLPLLEFPAIFPSFFQFS
jgi:hypothetical protein